MSKSQSIDFVYRSTNLLVTSWPFASEFLNLLAFITITSFIVFCKKNALKELFLFHVSKYVLRTSDFKLKMHFQLLSEISIENTGYF